MIRKLQRKFIMITMISLTMVMVLLVGAINLINYYQLNRKLDGAIQMLSENKGQFPEFGRERMGRGKPGYGFKMNAETPFELRRFIIKLNQEGNIIEIDTSHIAAVSSEDAAEYAEKILDQKKVGGFLGNYKFAVKKQDYGSMIIFIDCGRELQTAKMFLLISGVVAFATLLLVFLLVSIFSKRAIKPILESIEKQKQFITDAGHEIKTPLAIISANADVLELTGGENEWITSIRNQTSRLDKLVKNLLTLSKLDEENIELIFTNFNLSKVVMETAEPFKTIAETKKKEFIMDIQPEIMLNGDPGSLSQLISTLVDNAIKYSNENGTIRISLYSSKKGIRIEVYNTVERIENENLEQLFDRFYRIDASRSRETGGYGIGLSIARSIVQAHNGKIFAGSEDGKSIQFTVLI